MTFKEAMASLKKFGTAQNRKVYARHGATEPMFGVSYAHFGKLTKQIGKDHELAKELWASGNYDARILATMVADPAALDSKTLERWAKDLDCSPVAGALATLVARSPLAGGTVAKWKNDGSDFVRAAGWSLVGGMASSGAVSDADGLKLIKEIERGLHAAGNRTRYAMNGALIALGGYRAKLTAPALATAKRIGKVEVDHGETGCKTPDATAYIGKMLARNKAR
jgi:3-methyladenine DNA glycosylase AlkD